MVNQTNTIGFYYRENLNEFAHDVDLQFSISSDARLGEIFNMCKKFAIALGYSETSVDKVFGPDSDDW